MNDSALIEGADREYTVQRWQDGHLAAVVDRVAEETPVALIYNGLAHVVMMASPIELEDFALGFSLSEGIVERVEEVHAIETDAVSDGIAVYVDIERSRYLPLETQRRNLAARTSCGLCGTETIDQAVRHPPVVGRGVHITAAALQRAFSDLGGRQPLNATTGAVHAAAWALADGRIVSVREDVGRHNAVDKVLGLALMSGWLPLDRHVMLVSGRSSFEIMQKALAARIPIVAAVSAPSSLAVEFAEASGQSLVGFLREGRMNIYAGKSRVK